MLKRPKPSDTEQDVLDMVKEYEAEKTKNTGFQPAAKLVKVNKPKQPSKFAQRRELQKTSGTLGSEEKPSDKELSTSGGPSFIIGDIIEKKAASDDLIKIDRIVSEEDGFPKPKRIDKNIKLEGNTKKSLFALTQMKKPEPTTSKKLEEKMEIDPDVPDDAFGSTSCIIESAEGKSIHQDNIEFLKKCGQKDIMDEQQKLLKTLDPSLVNFLRERRKKQLVDISEVEMKPVEPPKSHPVTSLPDLDVLKNENLKNWMNFDVVETDKLEWMRDLPSTMPVLKPGESYEARFDWKGVLLPFTSKDENPSSELYLHGDDAHRPGYSLQELFRLGRSAMMQQRISALGSIGGILNIYNQGYYDGILELPISKIFFLLRYAFDDNTPAMVEVTAKALSTLFYNESDEVLLDITFDSSLSAIEPTLEVISEPEDDSQPSNEQNLEQKFSNLNLKNNLFQANLTDEDENKMSSLNDFHLAETDLIKCLLRTNILQRISYIFTSLNLENSTKLNCIKILIRLARTSRSTAVNILSHNELMKALLRQFTYVPENIDNTILRLHNSTKVVILKLFRILCAYSADYAKHLRDLGLNDVLKNCMFVQENSITIEIVKLQIEAYRCTRTIILTTKSDEYFDELMPALQYALEWIYQFVIFENAEHFLFRQCASSLIALLGSRFNSIHLLSDKLSMCFSKWFTAAMKLSSCEMSQIILLSTCLNAIQIPDQFKSFFQEYFYKFLTSKSYASICESMSSTSSLLSAFTYRPEHNPLPHLSSVVINKRNSPTFIIPEKSAFYLIGSIVNFYNRNKNLKNIVGFEQWFSESIKNYLKALADDSTWIERAKNWFVQREIEVIVGLLKSSEIQTKVDKGILLKLSYKIVGCLSDNQLNDILYLFSNFIFNLDFYDNRIEEVSMDNWKSLYAKVCVEQYLNNLNEQANSLHSKYNYDKTPMLPIDWPCMMLLKMYRAPEHFEASNLQERDVIQTTIAFLSLQNVNNLNVINRTDQFFYTILAFLGKNNAFLEPDINTLLASFVRETFSSKSLVFHLDTESGSKFNFENLYLSLLDQFQAASYGDRTFSVLVMVPLAQKYNVKWRLRVWSEYVHVLRFVTCQEEELIGSFDDYINPVVTDKTLLKSYFQALNSNILLPNSIPYKIAAHHVNTFRSTLKDKNVEN